MIDPKEFMSSENEDDDLTEMGQWLPIKTAKKYA